MQEFLLKIKKNRPNPEKISDEIILELNEFTKNKQPTLFNVLMFSLYPQAIFPNLCIIGAKVPGITLGDVDNTGARFTSNKRIKGTLPELIDGALDFVSNTMEVKTIIDFQTGKRNDEFEYPLIALREAILNAIIHRDYSVYTESQPITIYFFKDRVEITNPGGLYGRLSIDDLVKQCRIQEILILPESWNYIIIPGIDIPESRQSEKNWRMQDSQNLVLKIIKEHLR